jgi:Polyketide cyclase / dehydrase and lipid transport
MLATANVTKIVDAPVEKVWSAIRSIGGLDRWFPVIDSCRVDGQGVGATRTLGLVGGGEMRDRIVEIDEAERRFRYERFELPFPVENYRGMVQARARADHRSEIVWGIQFEVAVEKRGELVAFIEGAISDGLDGLEQELTRT